MRIGLFFFCAGFVLLVLVGCQPKDKPWYAPASGYELPRQKNLLFLEEVAWLTPEAAKLANEQLARGVFYPLEIEPDDRLQMSVSIKNPKMVAGQTLELQATFSNNSLKSLYFNTSTYPFYQQRSPFQCRIFDPNGKFYWGYNAHVQGPAFHELKDFLIEIKPNGSVNLPLSVQAISDFDTPISHSWPHVFPGRFLLTLTYDSRISYSGPDRRKPAELPDAWNGKLVSNSIQFEVHGKREESSNNTPP